MWGYLVSTVVPPWALWGYLVITALTSVCLIADRAAVTTKQLAINQEYGHSAKAYIGSRVCVCVVSATIAQSAVTAWALSE